MRLRLHPVLFALTLACGAQFAGIGMVVPVRVLYAQSHGASLAIISGMASSYLLANFIFQYPVGWAADRWGRRTIMVVGLVIQAAMSLVYLGVSDPVLFVVLRAVEGVVGATFTPPARAIIADVIPAEERGAAYGIFGAALNAGFLIGPAIGGFLASTGYASAFVGSCAFRLLAAVLVVTLVPAVGGRRTERGEGPRVPLTSLFTPPLVATYLLVFGDYLYLGYDMTLFPLWLKYHLGATVVLIGVAFVVWAVPTIVLFPLGGRVADRYRRWAIIVGCGLAQVPFYVAYGLLGSIWTFLILVPFHGVLYSFVQPAVDASLAAASPRRALARAQAVYSTVGLGSAFLAATAFAPLYSIDYRYPLWVMGVLYAICIVVGGLILRRPVPVEATPI